jgi:hypothetical protein
MIFRGMNFPAHVMLWTGERKPPHPALRAALSREGRGPIPAEASACISTSTACPLPSRERADAVRRPGEGAFSPRKIAAYARPFAIIAACALLSACIADPPAPSARLGDATHSNIAALAARPSDLAVPRQSGPRDAVRRDAVLAAYRQDGGQSKKESIAAVPAMEGGQR